MPRSIDGVCLEERVESALEHGLCALVGFPGIGKTTTADFVSAKLQQKGKFVVRIVPAPELAPGVRWYGERRGGYPGVRFLYFKTPDGKSTGLQAVPEIMLNVTSFNVMHFYAYVLTIAKVAENPEKFAEHVRKVMVKIVEELKRRKGEEKTGHIRRAIRKLKWGGGRAVEVVGRGLRRVFKKPVEKSERLHSMAFLALHTTELGEMVEEWLEEKEWLEVLESIFADFITDELLARKGALSLEMVQKGELAKPVVEFFSGLPEHVKELDMVEFLEKYATQLSMLILGTLVFTGIVEIVDTIQRERREKEKRHAYEIAVERLRKLRDRVVFVIDDLEDAKRDGQLLNAVRDLMRVIYEAKCPLLVVRRFSTIPGSKEMAKEIYTVLVGSSPSSPEERRLNVLTDLLGINLRGWGIRVRDIKPEQINLMLTSSYEEFRNILEANLPKEMFGKLGEREIEELWKRFCMDPNLAIALLMHGSKPEELIRDIEIKGVGDYHSKPPEKMSLEDIEDILSLRVWGFRKLYERIKVEKPYLIPLSFHPVAEDEMKAFLKEFADRPKELMDTLRRLNTKKSEVLVKKEKFKDKTRDVYDLDENAQKLGIYFSSLAEFDEGYLKDMAKIRLTLLRIMTEQAKKTGWQTTRMTSSSLDNAEFLLVHASKVKPEEIGTSQKELEEMLLFWSLRGIDINIFRVTHLRVAITSLQKGTNSALALIYLDRLIDHIRVSGGVFAEYLDDIENVVQDFSPDRDHLLALKLRILASTLPARISIRRSKGLLEKMVGYIEEAQKIKSQTLRRLTLLYLRDKIAESLLQFTISEKGLKEIRGLCQDMRRDLNWLEHHYEIDRETAQYLKMLGGDPKKKLKEGLIPYYESRRLYILGRVQLYLGDERSVESFQQAFKIADKLKSYGNAVAYLDWKHRAEVCLHWQYGEEIDLGKLKSYFEEQREFCSPETYSLTYAMIAVAEALNGIEVKELVDKELLYDDRALMQGVLAILGRWSWEEAKEELVKVDAIFSKEWIEDMDMLNFGLIYQRKLRFFQNGYRNPGRYYIQYEIYYFDGAGDAYEVKPEDEREAWLFSLPLISGIHTFIRILRLYLEGKIEEARNTAELSSKLSSSLSVKLFSQAAEALKNNDDDKFKEAMVKLFFFHV